MSALHQPSSAYFAILLVGASSEFSKNSRRNGTKVVLHYVHFERNLVDDVSFYSSLYRDLHEEVEMDPVVYDNRPYAFGERRGNRYWFQKFLCSKAFYLAHFFCLSPCCAAQQKLTAENGKRTAAFGHTFIKSLQSVLSFQLSQSSTLKFVQPTIDLIPRRSKSLIQGWFQRVSGRLSRFAPRGVASSNESRKQTPAGLRRIWLAGVAFPSSAWAADGHQDAARAALVGLVVFVAMLILPWRSGGR